eukprot:1886013-Pyramimonas_sp.AAC.1
MASKWGLISMGCLWRSRAPSRHLWYIDVQRVLMRCCSSASVSPFGLPAICCGYGTSLQRVGWPRRARDSNGAPVMVDKARSAAFAHLPCSRPRSSLILGSCW